MQIHELNNFTGTLGSGAYLAIDDGNDTGKISSQGLLAATEARIDNIIAGPAPSAEEIVDARLGDDGVTYPSLGDAIRDQFSDVKSDYGNITNTKIIDFVYRQGYIKTNVGVGNTVDLTPTYNNAFSYAIVDCSAGDKITLNAYGWTNGRLWAFLDSDNKVISASAASLEAINLIITAPANTAKCVLNSYYEEVGACYVGTPIAYELGKLTGEQNFDRNNIERLNDAVFTDVTYALNSSKPYLIADTNVGSVLDVSTLGNDTNYNHILLPVIAGITYVITTYASSTWGQYALLDGNYKILEKGNSGDISHPITIIATQGGYLAINGNVNSPHTVVVKNGDNTIEALDNYVLKLNGAVFADKTYELSGSKPYSISSTDVGEVLDISSFEDNPAYNHILLPITKGSTYIITTYASATYGQYAVLDDAYTILEKADSGAIANPVTITAMQDGYLAVNGNINSPHTVVEKYAESLIEPLESTIMFTGFDMYRTIAGVGDSYTAGAIVNSRSQWVTVQGVNYLDCIAKRNGVTANNYGHGGATAGSYLLTQAFADCLSDDPSDLYLIAFGINDSSQSVTVGTVADIKEDYTQNPDTFYGNYGRIVAQIAEHAPNAQIVLIRIWNVREEGDAYNTAIENIAEHFEIPCINPMDDTFFTSSFWSVKSGGHPTPMQYAGMGRAMERLFAKCVVENSNYFFYAIVG